MLRVTARRLARRVGGTKPVAAASNVPAPTPDDWQEVPDTASGKSCWWNKKTNETTAVGAPKPGPGPWEQVQDSSGQSYWWNKQTNQTTALGAPKPSALQPPPEAAAPAMAGGGGLRGALMDGLAWGVGTSVASRMMDGILGPRQMEVVHRNEDGGAGDALVAEIAGMVVAIQAAPTIVAAVGLEEEVMMEAMEGVVGLVEVMMSGERILFVTHAEVLNTLMNGSHKLWLLLFHSSIMAIGYYVSLMNGSHKTSFCVFHLLSVQHGLALTLSACKAGRGQLESGDLHIARCALAKECWKTRYPDKTKQTCTIYTYRII